MGRTLADISEDIGKVGEIYAAAHGIERSPDWYLLKLQEELGELAAAHLRLGGRARPRPDGTAGAREELEDEAADLFGQLVLFLRASGIDIESAVERKWLRYLPNETTAGPGVP